MHVQQQEGSPAGDLEYPRSRAHRFTQQSDHIQNVIGSFALSCNFLRTLTKTDRMFQSGLRAAVGNCREVLPPCSGGNGKRQDNVPWFNSFSYNTVQNAVLCIFVLH